jgi:hypothetical protein
MIVSYVASLDTCRNDAAVKVTLRTLSQQVGTATLSLVYLHLQELSSLLRQNKGTQSQSFL